MKAYRVAIVGATGMVGQEFIKVLEQRNFPVESLDLLASDRSAGKKLYFNHREIEVKETTPESFKGIDIALFSAGADISRYFAPLAVQAGAAVVDNSSAWRMDPRVPLVVPEINVEDIKKHKGIIANPNCSTIQMWCPLSPAQNKSHKEDYCQHLPIGIGYRYCSHGRTDKSNEAGLERTDGCSPRLFAPDSV